MRCLNHYIMTIYSLLCVYHQHLGVYLHALRNILWYQSSKIQKWKFFVGAPALSNPSTCCAYHGAEMVLFYFKPFFKLNLHW